MQQPVYQRLIRPLLFLLDAETAHHAVIALLAGCGPALARLPARPRDPRLERVVFGVRFPNPVGLAAGFDKNAVALRAWPALGFGFAEVGTVTARAQAGNPRPRIFRLPESRALINRLGFNNEGCDAVADRLRHLRESGRWPRIPVGINLGKSKITPLEEATRDYLLSFERLRHFGDYFVLNVSSPNTPGLRTLQDRAALDELLGTVQRRNIERKPLLLKIAPDLHREPLEEILALAQEHELAGIVASNTTVDHSALSAHRRTQGGLSGAPLRERATEMVRFIARHSPLPILAVGGIMSAADALEKFAAGAALVQLYTGLVYEGPGLVRRICEALSGGSSNYQVPKSI